MLSLIIHIMQKQVKAHVSTKPKPKFRKAHPVSNKSKGITREIQHELTKNINKKIEKEMTARAGKFNEPMTHHKTSKQAISRTGWIKPGKTRGNKA